MTSLAVALLFGILAASAQAQVADHLKCYKIKDSATKASYTADLTGLAPEPSCRILVPGKMLCVQTTKLNVNPPTGGLPGAPAGRFLCYKVKCAKGTLAAVPWSDQFGTRSVQPIAPKLLCAPETAATTTTTSSTTSTTAAASCVNGMKDGTETDIDCGGGICPPCAPGQMCTLGTDCQSSVCMAGMCQSPSCVDGVKNGNETGIDCGGGTCPACAAGQPCNGNTDCQSSVCMAGMCQSPSCTDMVKNGNETDVDCGGGTCPTCAAGKMCLVGTDCSSNVCSGGVCQP